MVKETSWFEAAGAAWVPGSPTPARAAAALPVGMTAGAAAAAVAAGGVWATGAPTADEAVPFGFSGDDAVADVRGAGGGVCARCMSFGTWIAENASRSTPATARMIF